ncbi:FAD:protein FMN transferase [Desulfospira joergensenii]|uniref:FAD:protein FMN transferase n=1 Tax=Desulfospira joergensenii TaxID=53329 RepID=UPI0003B5CA94|nr:FAD:protein FMN transferase [Desulfospira joergensenii]
MRIKFLLPVLFLIFFFPFSDPARASGHLTVLSGRTMGTFYTVKFISRKKESPDLWKRKIDICLKEVNARLSMYDPKSEISRFNRHPAHEPFKISRDFSEVLTRSRQIYDLSSGAWDGTVKPLVDLWGFGTRDRADDLPTPEAVSKALEQTGFNKLILKNQTLTATAPHITLDLGSIAKGYGVDILARLLKSSGIENFLVEVGGELSGSGKNKKGKPWAVGISRPEKKGPAQGLYEIISLDNMAIATSGNYRNFFVKDGKSYSHIIDPKTGYPVENRVVSASVIAPDCTFADGLATALMVMEVDRGIEMINHIDQVECLIIKKQGEAFVNLRSDGFRNFEQ